MGVPYTYPFNKHLTKHCTCPAQAVCRYECVVKCHHLQCPSVPLPKSVQRWTVTRGLCRGHRGYVRYMYMGCYTGGANHQRYVADVSAIGTMLQSSFCNKTLYSFVPALIFQ